MEWRASPGNGARARAARRPQGAAQGRSRRLAPLLAQGRDEALGAGPGNRYSSPGIPRISWHFPGIFLGWYYDFTRVLQGK